MQKQGVQLRRNRENNMEVMRIEKVFPLSVQPDLLGEGLAFGTVPVSAGIVGDALVPAVVTCVYMSAKDRCPAGHNAPRRLLLVGAHVVLRGISFKVRGEDVLNFNAHHTNGRQGW